MIFVIIIQGWLAADERLRQDLMQWTSALLVGEVLLAMILIRAEDLNLVLGFIRQDELGVLSTVVTLQVVLWLTVLFAYFPATLKRRIPYMPIGLAASLFIITPEASLIPWMWIFFSAILFFKCIENEKNCKRFHERSQMHVEVAHGGSCYLVERRGRRDNASPTHQSDVADNPQHARRNIRTR